MDLKVFLDTEFTDLRAPCLISMGLVAETGEELYIEVPYPDDACTPFVRETVIPLLGQIPNAWCSRSELGLRLISWLDLVRTGRRGLQICVDYQADWDLFVEALDLKIPDWCTHRRVARNINELLRYEFHKRHALPEHHALYDARANCYAFRERPSSPT